MTVRRLSATLAYVFDMYCCVWLFPSVGHHEENTSVQMGHSDDAVPILHEKGLRFDMVFMDQRSTRFHSDLETLERLGMLLPRSTVIADNVLKPGAPRWLWRIMKGEGYASDVVSVREFGSAETEDWMTVTLLLDCPCVVPPEPALIATLAARADRWRFRTVARNLTDTRHELESVNRDFTRDYEMLGIRRTKMVQTMVSNRGAISKVMPWEMVQNVPVSTRGGWWSTDLRDCEMTFPRSA